MQKILQTAVTPMLIYRLACIVGAVFIYLDGVLADARMTFPDWLVDLRMLCVFTCIGIFFGSFLSALVRRQIGYITLTATLLINGYCVAAAFTTSLGINEVLGCLMVLCVSSTVFHQIRLVIANLLGAALLNLAIAFPVVHPQVTYDKFVLSVLVFTAFFLLLMVSNLHARSQRERSEQAANAWFDNSADALIYGDVATETVKRANPTSQALFETTDNQELLEAIVGGILASDPDRRRADLLAEAAAAEVMEDTVKFTTAAGNQFWGAISLRKLKIADQTLTLVRITDVSTRVAHEEALEAAKAAAEQAVQTRTRFLANMSHEIRTPMNGVIGMASLLQETPLNEQQQNFLNTIRTSGEALLSIINEILDFSKIDADQVQLEDNEFDLHQCAAEAMEVTMPAGASKRLDFHLDIDSSIHRSYRGDVNRIRQVLVNLLSNAVKFTEAGSVSLRVARHQPGVGAANVLFQIIDTGVGIAPDKQNRLFDPFSQADASTTREYGGTGLGLSISKRLAKLMGGDITVESTTGKGSCFSFTLQLTAATPKRVVQSNSKSTSELGTFEQGELTFLVAEDNPVNQKVAIHMLKQLGIDADIVGNGREAIEALSEHGYDIIFMDVQMPEIDGLEASSLIRTSPMQQPYIIAMTANAMMEDRESCMAAGMDDFVAKPVRFEDLHGALAKAMQNRLEAIPVDAIPAARNSDENPYNSSPRA